MSFWKDYQFKDYLNVKKNEIKNLPKGVSISTMCGSCKLGTSINIDNIYNFLKLDNDDILSVKLSNEKERTLIPKKKTSRASKKKTKSNSFYNSITIVVRVNEGDSDDLTSERKVNMGVFNNGSIQMSGLKKYKYTNRALNKLIYRLKEIENNVHFIEDYDNISVYDFNIYMINSEYKLSTQINRTKLFDILYQQKYKCSYEKCMRACVIIKYKPDEHNEEEKEVTICIFEKGSVKISGARNLHNMRDSYNYINKIILQNIDDIVKNDEDEEIKLIQELYEEVKDDIQHKVEFA